ncbi:MAG TPA: VWA domain-containing protein, partial [Methylomirabilota bacterium]|nr:VWA domain-containing protein [Methylomirabilota bacterium]
VAGSAAVGAAGHSDYGAVFARFRTRHAGALGPRATLIVTGDARNNYRGPGLADFRALAARARRVFWLNPEPRARWDTTDSIMAGYAPHCHGVFEARTLRQLAAFVREIA